ncbi:hypothetical protein Ocin01_09204 [Orchesella cincta]|uniref:G-protein coupled receptors family 1 profile domain-containing protein n=1 Tax=Orchesella cincta TaxID=48709 RepID=A0A1D2MWY4_ORCCI|nr:hypothetical protein Ocin01_09204 [Orchesella cincta]
MNHTHNETVVVHGEWQCQFMDLAANEKDCSDSNPKVCIVCATSGKFFTGESVLDYYSTGHIVCLGLWVLTVVIGTVGVFTNSLIIAVIRARKIYIPFDYLLMVLACFDIFCCIASVFAMSAHVARYQNWISHNEFAVYWFYIGNLMTLQGRTVSTYMTILITIERFLVIAFPIRSRTWFTSGKTTFFAAVVWYKEFKGFQMFTQI